MTERNKKIKKNKTVVSVIVPTKNEEENIGRCLMSIQSSIINHQSSIEIIVIDNYSTDKTVEIAKKYTKKVFQKGPERSAQRNYGTKTAKGEILFFVDADMKVGKDIVDQAINLFQKDKKIKGIIVPEVSVGENYWARVRALERSCYLNSEVEAARIFDKKAFLKAGGYDEKLIAAEDWDLNARVKKLGKIGRIKGKIIHHEGKISLVNQLKKRYYYEKNIRFYVRKHPQKFKAQRGFRRVWLLLKNWRILINDPVHTLGVFIFSLLQHLIYLLAQIK